VYLALQVTHILSPIGPKGLENRNGSQLTHKVPPCARNIMSKEKSNAFIS
jgi:hypothetical protein